MINRAKALEIASYVSQHGEAEACRHFQIPEDTLARYMRAYRSYEAEDTTVVVEGAGKQKLRDINQELRKENREQYRLFNSIESVYSEYIELFKNSPMFDFTPPPRIEVKGDRTALLHVSDAHFNELIQYNEANGNEYDFSIASKRLHKFV